MISLELKEPILGEFLFVAYNLIFKRLSTLCDSTIANKMINLGYMLRCSAGPKMAAVRLPIFFQQTKLF
jgi:hypothetical protein